MTATTWICHLGCEHTTPTESDSIAAMRPNTGHTEFDRSLMRTPRMSTDVATLAGEDWARVISAACYLGFIDGMNGIAIRKDGSTILRDLGFKEWLNEHARFAKLAYMSGRYHHGMKGVAR